MIRIYNPRHFLRHGASQPMREASEGHIVLIRVGEVAPKGVPVLHNPKSGNAGKQFNKVRNKLYKLVEVDDKEYARLEKALARQNR